MSPAAVATDAEPAGRIRLVEFVASFGIGGTERHVVNLGRALDPARFALSFGCLKRWGDFLDEVETGGVPVSEYCIRSLYPHRTLPEQIRFARDLRRARVQIVHAYNVYANIFAVPPARIAGTPVVVASIRDTGVYLTPLQKRVQRMACRLADCVLVNAEAVRRWLEDQGYRTDRVAVIRNGVDLARFAVRPGDGALRRELGLPADAPLVLVLSRLDRNKGIEEFLEAAAEVASRSPRVRFLVVGDRFVLRDGAIVRDERHRDELEKRARELGLSGRVRFTGFRLDVPALLSEAAMSVLPSRSEGLSNAVLESMAAGVPVIATRVGGIPEAIEDGVSGLLVPPRDPGALARAMEVLLEHRELARRLGRDARRRVEERFSLERMVRETEALYSGMLDRALAGSGAGGARPLQSGPSPGRG
jgi:glycosyltransferase involved in cell wall biosynthesis